MTKYFYEAISEDTAHVVEDYPWGFNLRTSVKFWIETNKRGSRFMKRTFNPKTGVWCAIKKSTYSPVMVLAEFEIDGGPRTSYVSSGHGHATEKIEDFKVNHWDNLDDERRKNLDASLICSKVMTSLSCSESVVDQSEKPKFVAVAKFDKTQTQVIIDEIKSTLDEVLPSSFRKEVEIYRMPFSSCCIKIAASPSTYLISHVPGQYPQTVSLRLDLDGMILEAPAFCGMGGGSFYRSTRPDLYPKEKYDALGSVHIPFRKPKPGFKYIYPAIERFFSRYLSLLKDWGDDLLHKEHGDYSFLEAE